jgi:hypothetical protein
LFQFAPVDRHTIPSAGRKPARRPDKKEPREADQIAQANYHRPSPSSLSFLSPFLVLLWLADQSPDCVHSAGLCVSAPCCVRWRTNTDRLIRTVARLCNSAETFTQPALNEFSCRHQRRRLGRLWRRRRRRRRRNKTPRRRERRTRIKLMPISNTARALQALVLVLVLVINITCSERNDGLTAAAARQTSASRAVRGRWSWWHLARGESGTGRVYARQPLSPLGYA